MSVYHKWKCVFIKIPKTATSSIHSVLKNLTDEAHEHQTYIEIIQKNDIDLLDTYYSFAVVRNPYDRLVSVYEQDHSNYFDGNINDEEYESDEYKKASYKKFKKFVNNIYNSRYLVEINNDRSCVEQFKFITIKNIILVDDVLRFENINEDWKKTVKKINEINDNYKASDKLPLENVTSRKASDNWEDYYDDETREMVYEIYKKDFELFGYEK